MDVESELGWIAFSITNNRSFCESFIEDTILKCSDPSVSREVSVYE
jgi:hypothetical protein